MSRISELFLSKQFLRFLVSGGIAALVNFFSRFFFQQFFTYAWSVALSFSLGTGVSFFLNKAFTFASYDERTSIQFVKFILIALVGIMLASFAASAQITLYRLLGWPRLSEGEVESIAHIVTIAGAAIYNFLAMKYFSFRRLKAPHKVGIQ